MDTFVEYYSRKEVQQAILRFSKDREVAPRFGDGFGRRPDILQYPGDVLEMAQKGATSFHISEERWEDPLRLKPGVTKKELDENRIGWDLILDIDVVHWDYAKWTAYFLVEALKFHDVKNISVKFSVTGDTPVLVKNREVIQLLPLRKVINMLKNGENIEVLSCDKNLKLTYSKVYDFLAHKDQVYKLFHNNSTIPLKVTAHHSVFCWEKGFILEKKVNELKKGDYLVTYKQAQDIKRKEPKIKWEYTFNRKIKNKDLEIKPNFLRLIGYYLSEGHATESIKQVGFSFNVNEIEYIEDCKKLIKEYFPSLTISERRPNPSTNQILIHSKEVYTLFKYLCNDKKTKKVPNFCWELPKNYFLELLKAYIRGDGHKRGEYTITIKSVVPSLITQFVWLCKLNGISCNLSFEKNKEHQLPSGNLFKGSFVYMIKIPKSELEIEEFYRKRNKYSPFPQDRLLPVDGLREVYYQCKPGQFLKHRPEEMTLKKKQANCERIKKVIKWIEDYKKLDLTLRSRAIIENYKLALKSDLSLVSVTKIEKLKRTIVYDLSVENTERFFGNYYPLLLHNSGSKGFHLAVPFESFPSDVNGKKIKHLFPEGPRIITAYLENMIKEMLANKILEKENYDKIAERTGMKKADFIEDGKFNPFKIIEIDTVLISSRHLFRAPYSLHEKTKLVSVPIDINKILDFEKVHAEPKKVKTNLEFLDMKEKGDAKGLIIQAYDWWGKIHEKKGPDVEKRDFIVSKDMIGEEYFPACIKKILNGMEDGKKRGLFILLNFFKSINWKDEDIEKRIKEWNAKNREPLGVSYIQGQINWAKKQKESILPPNCSTKAYYSDLRIACNPDVCKKFKNPVNCAKWNEKISKKQQKVEKK